MSANSVWPQYKTEKDELEFAAKAFAEDITRHNLTIDAESEYGPGKVVALSARADGGRAEYWFDVVATPTMVTIHGDMGTFVFARYGSTDQLSLFRAEAVNPDYWAQKCVAGAKEAYSEDAYVQTVIESAEEHIAEAEEDDDPDFDADAYRTRVASAFLLGGPENESEAYEMLARGVIDGMEHDSMDVNVSRPTYHFLWCLHALQWAVKRYDDLAAHQPAA